MTNSSRLHTSVINLSSLLTRFLVAVGTATLLSGFSVTEVVFDSMEVPPSKFKVRLAKQKGLPAPEGTPGSPVKATLTKPVGEGPFPAIVMFPNGGGWPDTPRHWRERLNTWGYVTLEVWDENEVPDYMEPPMLVLDALGALKYLQGITYVDRDRIAVMGWDQGAEIALWSIDASSWAGKHKNRFVAAVAFYPPCDLLSASQFFSPALIISPELSDFAKPSRCERLVKSVPVELKVPIMKIIPGAYQWFDLPHRPAQLEDLSYTQAYDHTYEYNAKATDAAANHVRAFLEAYF